MARTVAQPTVRSMVLFPGHIGSAHHEYFALSALRDRSLGYTVDRAESAGGPSPLPSKQG